MQKIDKTEAGGKGGRRAGGRGGLRMGEKVTKRLSFREDRNKGKEKDRGGRVKDERKGHSEGDKEGEEGERRRFRDVSPSFKSYSMTNTLPRLGPLPRQLHLQPVCCHGGVGRP